MKNYSIEDLELQATVFNSLLTIKLGDEEYGSTTLQANTIEGLGAAIESIIQQNYMAAMDLKVAEEVIASGNCFTFTVIARADDLRRKLNTYLYGCVY